MAGKKNTGYVAAKHLVDIGGREAKLSLNCPGCQFHITNITMHIGKILTCSRCHTNLEAVWWRGVTDPKELEDYLSGAASAPATSFDYETTGPDKEAGLDPYRGQLCGVSFSREDEPGVAIYVPLRHNTGQNMDPATAKSIISPFLQQYPVNAHNAIFEYKWSLLHMDAELKVASDTQIEAFLDDPNRAGGKRFKETNFGLVKLSLKLKQIAQELWGLDVTEFKDLVDTSRGMSFADVPMSQAIPYGCQDSDLATRLKKLFHLNNLAKQKSTWELEHYQIPIIAQMELRGIWLDPTDLAAAVPALDAEIEQYEREVFKALGYSIPDTGPYMHPFSLDSPMQVAKAFFSSSGLNLTPQSVGKPNKHFPEGQPKVGKDVLEDYREDHPAIDSYLHAQESKTMRDDFVTKLPDYINETTGFIHGSIHNTGAPTGRFAHSDPNLAQVPKKRD